MKTVDAIPTSCFRLLGLTFAAALAFAPAARGELYVTTFNGPTVQTFHSITGASINPNFIVGLTNTQGCFLSGNDLYLPRNTVVDKYNATTAAPVSVPLVSGGSVWHRGTVSGSDLYVLDAIANKVGKYSTSGATVNADFLTGLNNPAGIAVSGTDLYVSSGGANVVGLYTTAGATASASFITGLNQPRDVVVHQGKLYVANFGTNSVGVYNAVTGAPINASFITGLNGPTDLEIYLGRLYVVNGLGGSVGLYDAASGAVIDPFLIAGVTNIEGLAIKPVPTPTVQITGPKSRRVSTPSFRLRGSSSGAASIEVRVGRSKFTLGGTTAWSKTLRLKPGANRITVQATNSEGVSSALAKATLTRSAQ